MLSPSAAARCRRTGALSISDDGDGLEGKHACRASALCSAEHSADARHACLPSRPSPSSDIDSAPVRRHLAAAEGESMTHASRCCFATAMMALAMMAGVAAAAAQSDYPTRPVRVVVGFGPGSAADLTARVVAQRLSQTMGQPFVTENRAGAGSSIAAESVARAEKDGHTLFVG